jgi:hypothetical protein
MALAGNASDDMWLFLLLLAFSLRATSLVCRPTTCADQEFKEIPLTISGRSLGLRRADHSRMAVEYSQHGTGKPSEEILPPVENL